MCFPSSPHLRLVPFTSTEGQMNVCYNCVDRHIAERGDQVAIIHEGDELGASKSYTYKQVLEEVCRVANVLLTNGVRKGDIVAIYMPMMADIAFVMLACARIGAVHSVVFAGFSADSLRDRILDANCKWVITADEGKRGGRTIPLKQISDVAVLQCACVEKVFVYARTGSPLVEYGVKDIKMEDALASARPFCPCVTLDSEDPFFLLYTSGSTGKPKGVQHTQAGYLLYAMLTHLYVFDYRPGDVYACVADCGWITGHSYIVYGPMANGATTVMFESTPLYPDHGRYWDLVQRHKVTQFYTAPTAIRALMRYGEEEPGKYDLSSLRVLGTVGEPINPEAWRWYDKVVGKGKAAIVDTFWQTETGGIVVTPLPGATPTKAGSATFPFFGIQLALMTKEGEELKENGVAGMLCIKDTWPSLARTVYGNHLRYLNTYMRPFPGKYFTGDGAYRDNSGYIWITGRVDDVLNVSGHRLGSAEIESALVEHPRVAESAVIGFPHETKGQGICCYVTVKEGVEESKELLTELKMQVRKGIGPFATPDYIVITPSLPKTRSGKIMRRVLRKIISRETHQLGDISTLADSSVVEKLIKKVERMFAAAGK
jgi:acetyl-CoA synthetase